LTAKENIAPHAGLLSGCSYFSPCTPQV